MRRKNKLLFSFLFVLSVVGILYTFFFVSPKISWHALLFYIPAAPLVPLLLFLFMFSLMMLLFHNKTHALLAGFFVSIYALLRINGFIHPFFFLMLAAIFLLLELFFRKR